jgi:hypothetical protein
MEDKNSTTFSSMENFLRALITAFLLPIPRKPVGHKLGEFAPTRTYKGHAADDKKTRRK